MTVTRRVAFALGANLGDRAAALQAAVDGLASTPGVRAVALSPRCTPPTRSAGRRTSPATSTPCSSPTRRCPPPSCWPAPTRSSRSRAGSGPSAGGRAPSTSTCSRPAARPRRTGLDPAAPAGPPARVRPRPVGRRRPRLRGAGPGLGGGSAGRACPAGDRLGVRRAGVAALPAATGRGDAVRPTTWRLLLAIAGRGGRRELGGAVRLAQSRTAPCRTCRGRAPSCSASSAARCWSPRSRCGRGCAARGRGRRDAAGRGGPTHEPVPPLVSARFAVLSLACSRAGALFVGVYGGVPGHRLSDLDIDFRRHVALVSGACVLAAVLLVVAGLVLEHELRLPGRRPAASRRRGRADSHSTRAACRWFALSRAP